MARNRRGPDGAAPEGPEDVRRPRGPEDHDDTEGHIMLPNETLVRRAAMDRERDIRRNLQRPEVKSEGRRPFFRKGK
jgi:hypothetical protein